LSNDDVLPTASIFTESSEIFPAEWYFLTKLGLQVSPFPVPFFGVNKIHSQDCQTQLRHLLAEIAPTVAELHEIEQLGNTDDLWPTSHCTYNMSPWRGDKNAVQQFWHQEKMPPLRTPLLSDHQQKGTPMTCHVLVVLEAEEDPCLHSLKKIQIPASCNHGV
jgi:hypothetical protein